MSPRTPRHLAEHRLPWRLMLVAFGLTFAVLAALVASAALVPKAPLAPSAVQQLPAETTGPPYPADAPSVAPSSAGPGSSSTSTTVPQEPAPGVSPIALAAQAPTTAAAVAPRATTPATTPRTTGPPATPAPTTTEPPAAPVISVAPTTTVEPTTTTVAPTTTTVEATTTTAALAPTTIAEATTTTQLLVTTTQPPTAGVLLAPLLGLLYLLRAHLPAPGRHARPGRYLLPQVRSRRATRRPPRRARTRP